MAAHLAALALANKMNANQKASASAPKGVKASWWHSLTETQRKVIVWTAIVLGLSLVSFVAIKFGSVAVKNVRSNQELTKIDGSSKFATWANLIGNALDNNGIWFGTDEQALRRVLREIPSKQDWEKVKRSYKVQFKGNVLVDDMRKDLSTTEFDEMLAIINSKPNKARDVKKGAVIYDPIGWAKRINAAVNYRAWGWFWGTDEDAITAVVMEIPSQKAYQDTAEAYRAEYGIAMITDLEGDLSESQLATYRKMILQKPKT